MSTHHHGPVTRDSAVAKIFKEVLSKAMDLSLKSEDAMGTLCQKIKPNNQVCTGGKWKRPMLLSTQWTWRPIKADGSTVIAGDFETAYWEGELKAHNSAYQLNEFTRRDLNSVAAWYDVLGAMAQAYLQQLPYYKMTLFWTGTNGVIGVVDSVDGNSVVLNNTGMAYGSKAWEDGCRANMFCPSMIVQTLTSAGLPRGLPIKVLSVDYENDTVHFSSVPTGLAATDRFVVTTIDGGDWGDKGYGLFDLVSNNNTDLQGIDQTNETYALLRSQIDLNGGVARKLDLYDFSKYVINKFRNVKVTEGHCNWQVLARYWEEAALPNIRYDGLRAEAIRSFNHTPEALQFGPIRLNIADDVPLSYIVIGSPSRGSLFLAQDSDPYDVDGGGGPRRIPGRLFWEMMNVLWRCQYAISEPREWGLYGSINPALNVAS